MYGIKTLEARPVADKFNRIVWKVAAAATALPVVLGVAGAEGEADAASQLTTTAKAGMTALGGLIVGILLVGIGITVLWFANRHTKQAVTKS